MVKRHARIFSRRMNWKHALRKRRIDLQRSPHGVGYYKFLHQYSKNKIHCSCDMCKNEDWSAGRNSIHQRSISDQRKLTEMNDQLLEGV